ncbi:MAG: hypothetical protein IT344_03565 [Candidatus Dadabacteria bacterium]|nr:hypothetical protein [Candidatus Dadabacteria bacterium]
MFRTLGILYVALILFGASILFGGAASAAESDITTAEFRQLYTGLLAGKTLVSTSEEDGVTATKARTFGQPMNAGDGSFDITTTTVITKTKDGAQVQKVTINILDRVSSIGGKPIIYEEARSMVVEEDGAEPRTTEEGEFVGLFRASKNGKGGFDVHNFGLIPSVEVEGDSSTMAGSNLSFSCYPAEGVTECVLTVRDYKLGDYTPLVGYRLLEPIGGDFVETAREVGN